MRKIGIIRNNIGRFIKTHGLTNTIEFKRWMSMRQRCREKPVYLKKGIKVCPQWDKSFESFLKDMGKAPSIKHGIERKDNNGNYEPNNCIWATQKVQNRNYSLNRNYTINGVTKCVTDWALEYGKERGLVYNRLRAGWDIIKALNEPIQVQFSHARNIST